MNDYTSKTIQTYNSRPYTADEIENGKMQQDVENLRQEFSKDSWIEKDNREIRDEKTGYNGFTFVLERRREKTKLN